MVADTVSSYIDATEARLKADGCEVSTDNWSGTPVLIGYRSDFRLQWIATKLHLFTIVAAVPSVTAASLEAFTTATMDYALARKGQLRGLQSGVAVLPCMVSTNVEPAAIAWAQEKQRLRFACMARPVVVDPTRGVIGCFRGNSALGRVYSGHLRGKLNLYFSPAA